MSIIVQRDATIHSFITFSADSSTCFGWYHPSSGAHSNSHYNIWHWSNRIATAHRPVPGCNDKFECAPDDGWGYHPKHVEMYAENIIKLYTLASRWTIIDNVTVMFTECESYKFAKKSGMRYWDMADTSLPATGINEMHEPTPRI